jgi:flagellar motor switch protein FliG
VTARLVDLEEPAPIALEHLRNVVMAKLRDVKATVEGSGNAGARRVAEMLGRMRRSKEIAIVEDMEKEAPETVQKVNKYRITVERVLALSSRELQRVLRDVDSTYMPTLMKGLDDSLRQTILSNMSARAADRLAEEVENLGPVKVRDIEAAHQQLIGAARELEARGEIRLRDEEAADEEDEDA